MTKIRPIAIHLPQFHPIPENDLWWGKGFTEWRNVTKAAPLFKHHIQPHLPSDLGFYDLRATETRQAQAEMAQKFGIYGFAYYHYWFNGKQLLERPIKEILQSKQPNFPFCLIWANETWSRRWLGEDKEILMKQEYSSEDHISHALYLSKVFADDRYILVKGRPLFVIYKPENIPDLARAIEKIKNTVLRELGKEPYLLANNSNVHNNENLYKAGFDGFFSFRPQLAELPRPFEDSPSFGRLMYNLKKFKIFSPKLKLYDYKEALNLMERLEPETFENTIPSVFVGWDNSARRGNRGIIMLDNKPELFKKELQRVIAKLNRSSDNLHYVFINAWNEWAEGNYLEPSVQHGYSFLNAVRESFND